MSATRPIKSARAIMDLEAENQRLRDRIDELEEMLALKNEVPSAFRCGGARRSAWRIFSALSKRQILSKEAMMVIAYGHRNIDDRPDEKIMDVIVCNLRKWLRPYQIEITTHWGRGYYLTPEMQGRARDLIAALTQVAEAAE